MTFAFSAWIFAAIAVLWALVVDGPGRLLALVPALFSAMMALELVLARGRRLVVLVVLAGLAALALPAVALAADPVTVGALFGDLREVVFSALSVVVSAIVGLIAWGVWRLTGVKLDDSMRAALQSALENGIHAGLNAVQGAADKARPGILDNDVVQIALGYVRQFAPGAVRHFGLDDASLAALLKAQLGKIVPVVPSA